MIRVSVPVYLPTWLYREARRWKRVVFGNPAAMVNLWGDREVEWSFIAANLPVGPGNALDFGGGGSYLSLIAARRGFRVTAFDLEQQDFYWQHRDVSPKQGDVLTYDFLPTMFDLIINCSAVEHVGLVGRYSVNQPREDGDLEAMTCLRRVLTLGGLMLLTVPVGQDDVISPLHRVYGERRLPQLLDGFAIDHEEYWVKDASNRWNLQDRTTALAYKASGASLDPSRNCYALGCLVLRRPV